MSPVKSCQAFQNSLVSLLEIYFRDRVKRCRLMLRANDFKRRSLHRQYCKFLFHANVNFTTVAVVLVFVALFEVISFQFWQRAILITTINNNMLSFNIYHMTFKYTYLFEYLRDAIVKCKVNNINDKNFKIF